MAGPVMHILLALKVISAGYLQPQDIPAFVVGTSFADIRYLKVIEREKTHYNPIAWSDVVHEKSSFFAGLKLHSFVDRVREEYWQQTGIYNELPAHPLLSQCMKLVEDEIVYQYVDDWHQVAHCFDRVYKEELSFGIAKIDIEHWHGLLQLYIKQPPEQNSTLHFLLQVMPALSSKAGEVQKLITQLQRNERFKTLVLEFYDSFEQLLM